MTFDRPSYSDAKNVSDIRIRILFGIFVALFILISLRLFKIQVLDHDKYRSIALNQYWDSHELTARRGDIISSDGFLLAGTQINYLMYLEPNKIEDKHATAYKLSKVMAGIMVERQSKQRAVSVDSQKETVSAEIDIKDNEEKPEDAVLIIEDENKLKTLEEHEKELEEKYLEITQKDLMWYSAEHGINPVEKELIEKEGIPGIGFEEEPVRFYSEDNLLSHVLGFVASNDIGEKVGYFGIEGSFNEDLRGKEGRILEEIDALGTPILMGDFERVEPIQGRDVVLTINKSIQYMVEKKLKNAVEKYDAVSGTVIVMEPSNGNIVAMANYPTYSSAEFYKEGSQVKSSSHRKTIEQKNLAITDVFEPGSVFKPLTISAAIDIGLVTPETTYQDNGPVWYSSYKVDNWDFKHPGTLNIIQLLQKSNNIGAAWVGHKVGAKNLYNYLNNFGIGTKTGVSLEGEDTEKLLDYHDWVDINTANISFGQGVSVNSLQMINAFNVFANGGFLLQPRIVEKVIDNGKVIDIPTKTVRRVLKSETAETMVYLLEKAAEGGEAKYFVLKNYRIAGKTGTAQVPVPGGYDPERTVATFVGFDAVDKKFTLLVKLQEPRTQIFASETSVPVWMEIFTELVKFYGIAPNKQQPLTLIDSI